MRAALLYFLVSAVGCLFTVTLHAQIKGGQFSGDLQLVGKFYQADSARNAVGTPFYDYLHYSADAWLTLNYRTADMDIGVRFDAFQNSSLFNPTRETNAQAIGRWYITKQIDRLTVTGGYFYDQYGAGITFRSYENRYLGIDQAMFGIQAQYDLTDNWTVKAFTGRLKRQLDPDFSTVRSYRPVIKGLTTYGFKKLGEHVSIAPGLTVVGRTIDPSSMQTVVSEINGYPEVADRFEPKFNTYAGSVFNTLQLGDVSWYTEVAGKSEDVIRDASGQLFNPDNGLVWYNTLNYSRKGFGITLQGKYTENFDFRTSPLETQNNGLLNFLPPMGRQNVICTLARYAPVTQYLGEMGIQGDITYSPKRGYTFNVNYTHIENLDKVRLFNEMYLDFEWIPKGKPFKGSIGIQALDYNIFVYQQKNGFVNTLTPFTEGTYKFSKKTSLKYELSYLLTKRDSRLFGKDDPIPDEEQDLGDFGWALLELSVAPHYSVAVSNMHNFGDSNLSYPTFFVSYSKDVTRLALSYTKQPEGVVCTGGVCRFEPAFSGVRLDLTTTF